MEQEEKRGCIGALIYGALLGWYLHAWWKCERARIIRDAIDQADEYQEQRALWRAAREASQPQPVPEASAGGT